MVKTENPTTSYNQLRIATAIALATLSIAQLFVQFAGNEFAEIVSRIAFLALCVFLFATFKLREWALVGFAIILTVGLASESSGVDDIYFALDRATFFAAFIYLVTLLKEAAQRSPSVLRLGTFLTNQPPGKRYYSLAFGGHIMGVLLNFGAISLLTPLIQRGARAGGMSTPEQRLSAARHEQQQISALLRGFSWMIMWSPTALTQAVLFTAFPGVDLWIIIPLGIASSLVMIGVGRFEGLMRWRNIPAISNIVEETFPMQAALRFATICTVLISATLIVAHLAIVSGAVALMLVAPLIMAGWVFEQDYTRRIFQSVKLAANNLTEILTQSSTVLGRSAVTLGAAGYIGEAAAKLAPINALATGLETLAIPGWLILICLPVIITLCGQIALSPILVVVFLSSVLNQLPVLPADANLNVFALGAGWALSMTASPNASATLLISGVTGIAPTTLTWRWNGTYALICFAIFALSFFVFYQFVG